MDRKQRKPNELDVSTCPESAEGRCLKSVGSYTARLTATRWTAPSRLYVRMIDGGRCVTCKGWLQLLASRS